MRKVLIADDLNELVRKQDSFLNRSGIRLYPVSSNDELLNTYRFERADLIITRVDMPGMSTEQVAAKIREADARTPLLLVSDDSRRSVEQCSRCKPDAVILLPVNPLVLTARAQQLLGIAWRENYRAIVNVAVEGNAGDNRFLCRSRDVSVSGMLLEAEKKLTLGGRISCSFLLPDSAVIRPLAEVVRVVENIPESGLNHYGVKFLILSADERKALESFIHRA